jgi:phosphate starvation-inducible PhoH-like protein
MQMFLTRMGHGSKMVVTGDITQVDLADPSESGLTDAIRRLRRVRGIGFSAFEGADVVRHSLVQRVIEAYGLDEHGSRSGDNASLIREPRPTARSEGSASKALDPAPPLDPMEVGDP